MNFGAIFDWDGVIIDSSSQHELSWEMLAEEEKGILPEGHFHQGFGHKNQYVISNVLGWTDEIHEITRLSLRKEELYRGILIDRGLNALPGVSELLSELYNAGIPCAVGSSTPRLNLDLVIETLGFEKYFKTIVSGDDVGKGKPDPEVFLLAATGIGMEPEQCVVFEDAHVGIEAGISGGMKVLGVATTNPISELTKADLAVNRLTEVNLEILHSMFDQS